MTDTTTNETEAVRAARRELIEHRASQVALSPDGTGINYENILQVWDAAKLYAQMGPMLPPWLQGNTGGMFGIVLRAKELNMSVLTLANWTYVVENKGVTRIAYESQYFHALIESHAPIKERLHWEIIGEGEDRRCRVWATLKGETEPRVFLSDTLAKLRPGKNQYGQTKGSPLWDSKPDLQLFYNASRDFARVYFPDVLGGCYGVDEMVDVGGNVVGPDATKDVSPNLRQRLRGPVGEGFEHERSAQSIEAAIASATVIDPKKPGKAKPDEPTASQTPSSDPASIASGSSSEATPTELGTPVGVASSEAAA